MFLTKTFHPSSSIRLFVAQPSNGNELSGSELQGNVELLTEAPGKWALHLTSTKPMASSKAAYCTTLHSDNKSSQWNLGKCRPLPISQCHPSELADWNVETHHHLQVAAYIPIDRLRERAFGIQKLRPGTSLCVCWAALIPASETLTTYSEQVKVIGKILSMQASQIPSNSL